MNDAGYMQRAIDKAREGIAAGQTPFGSIIVREGAILASAHNTVWRDKDPTAHAEVNAIRQASIALGAIKLHGAILYTTCEPCPMCLAAIHWAKIARCVFGAGIADATAAGFGELQMPAAELARRAGSPLIVEAGPLRDECRQLFELWRAAAKSRPY